jgi:hypothetical protein
LKENPRFLVAALIADYLPWHLIAQGYRVTPVPAGTARAVLYDVQAPVKE